MLILHKANKNYFAIKFMPQKMLSRSARMAC